MDHNFQNQQQHLHASNLGSQIKEKYQLDNQSQQYSQDLVRSTVAKYANQRSTLQNSQLQSQSGLQRSYSPFSLNNENQSTIRNTVNVNTTHGNTVHGDYWDNKHSHKDTDDQLLLKYSTRNNQNNDIHTETVKHHSNTHHTDNIIQHHDDLPHQQQIQRSQSPVVGKRVEHMYYKQGEYEQLEKQKHKGKVNNHIHENQQQHIIKSQDGTQSELRKSKSPSKSKIVRVIRDGKVVSEERVDLEFNHTHEQHTRTSHIESEPRVHHELKQVNNLEPKVQPQVNTRLISSKVIEKKCNNCNDIHCQGCEVQNSEVDENYAVCTIF